MILLIQTCTLAHIESFFIILLEKLIASTHGGGCDGRPSVVACSGGAAVHLLDLGEVPERQRVRSCLGYIETS